MIARKSGVSKDNPDYCELDGNQKECRDGVELAC